MKFEPEIEKKIADAAFCTPHDGWQERALKKLLGQPDLQGFDTDVLNLALSTANEVHNRANELTDLVLADYGSTHVASLPHEQFIEAGRKVKAMLLKEYPGSEVAIDYNMYISWSVTRYK